MPSRIDHVIIAAPALDTLEMLFTRLGFAITGGGLHPHLGTRNRIIVLGEGYIELLAIADEARASAALRERIAHGGGWVGYALQSDDIAAETHAMRTRGVDVRGAVAGRLVAPDGTARSWRVATIGSDDLWSAAFPLPFLIQHDSEGERHQRELAGADGPMPHPNGATHLVGVTIHTADSTALCERYEHAYGLRAAQASLPTSPEPDAAVYPLHPSGEWIAIAQNAPEAAPDPIMSVCVGAADIATVERAIEHAGLPAKRLPGTLSLTLPDVNAELQFSV